MKAIVTGLVTTLLAWGMVAGTTTAGAATGPPTAATGAAMQVTASSAVVSGSVNPHGAATTYMFEYGPTTKYGFASANTSVGSGTSPVAVHATLPNLISNSTYHYRILALTAAGPTPGADGTFTTAKAPPTVTVVSQPSAVRSASADVSGTVNPNGKATTYLFEYGPTPKYGLATVATTAGTGTTAVTAHATLPNLASGTMYHYRVLAQNADGTSVSQDATFLTTGNRVVATGPLPVVSEAAAVKITTHGAQLNGAVNPKGSSTTWYFEFGLTTDYGLQSSTETLTGLGARPVNVVLNGLQAGSVYHYRLVVLSANGLYVGPDHTFSTKRAMRENARLQVNARAHRSNGVVTIAVNGQLQPPSDVPSDLACIGTVAVQFKQNGVTVALRHAQLRSDCSYRLTAHIPAKRVRGNRSLSVIGYFWGNAALHPSIQKGSVSST